MTRAGASSGFRSVKGGLVLGLPGERQRAPLHVDVHVDDITQAASDIAAGPQPCDSLGELLGGERQWRRCAGTRSRRSWIPLRVLSPAYGRQRRDDVLAVGAAAPTIRGDRRCRWNLRGITRGPPGHIPYHPARPVSVAAFSGSPLPPRSRPTASTGGQPHGEGQFSRRPAAVAAGGTVAVLRPCLSQDGPLVPATPGAAHVPVLQFYATDLPDLAIEPPFPGRHCKFCGAPSHTSRTICRVR